MVACRAWGNNVYVFIYTYISSEFGEQITLFMFIRVLGTNLKIDIKVLITTQL